MTTIELVSYREIKVRDIVLAYRKGIWQVTGFHDSPYGNNMQVDLELLCDSKGNKAKHILRKSSCCWEYIRPFTEDQLNKWKEFDNKVYEKIKTACGL